MLPVEGGTFRIDTAIAEVTVVVLKENPKVRTVLADPAGRRFMATQAESGIQWLVTERFDMITVTRPKAGVWELVANGERGHAYVITDMKLATNVGKHGAAVAGTAVQAWLSRDGQVLTQAEILANTRFTAEILRPDGTATELVLAPRGQSGDGIYSGVTGAEAPGNYEVRLSAQSPTFARKVTRYFSVAPAAPGVKAGTTTAAPKPAVAADQEGRETKAALTTPDQPAPVTNSKPATAAKRKSKAAAASPASPEKSGSGEINLWVVLAAFTGINLVLGGIGVGVYWWLRKKSIKSGLTRFLEPGQESMAAMDKQGAPEVAKA
jgi:hypothetical protein